MKYYLLFALFLVLGLSKLSSQVPTEHILSYDIDIQVNKDRSILVTEYIKVQADKKMIKRGITRDFPNTRKLGTHGLQRMDYKIISVMKDNIDEPYHFGSNQDNMLMYIGSENVFLESGIYDYTIKYKVENQIAFYDSYDEFYWNPIGHFNDLYTAEAHIEIIFPNSIKLLSTNAFTGKFGEKEKNYTETIRDNIVEYSITKPLDPKEGFTLQSTFSKGIFLTPGFLDRFSILIAFLGLCIFLGFYYFYTWHKYGRDPDKVISQNQFDSPKGLSPAASSYILHEKNKSITVSASFVDLINKKYIGIKKFDNSNKWNAERSFVISELNQQIEELPLEQNHLLKELFNNQSEIIVDGNYNKAIKNAYTAHGAALKEQYRAFITQGNNAKKALIPLFVSILGVVLLSVLHFRMIYNDIIPWYAILIFGIVALIALFIYLFLIQKPTLEKLELQSQIRSFKKYLGMSEDERDQIIDSPKRTIEHYERLLPFAISLKVDEAWKSSFTQLLTESAYFENNDAAYIIMDRNFNNNFTQSFAQSSIDPSVSSSSSSGSGGFSGGGGGGGGGGVGGW